MSIHIRVYSLQSVASNPSQWPRGLRRRYADACWDSGFESNRGQGCLSFVSVVCFEIEVSAMGRSLVRRSPTERGVSECDLETSTMRMSGSTRNVETRKKQQAVCNVNISMFRKIYNL